MLSKKKFLKGVKGPKVSNYGTGNKMLERKHEEKNHREKNV